MDFIKLKINLNLYFCTSLWCLRGIYEGLNKTFEGTTKKCENKNITWLPKIRTGRINKCEDWPSNLYACISPDRSALSINSNLHYAHSATFQVILILWKVAKESCPSFASDIKVNLSELINLYPPWNHKKIMEAKFGHDSLIQISTIFSFSSGNNSQVR